MAVKANEALNEEDSSDRELSYNEEEDVNCCKEKEDEEGAAVNAEEELRELHKRISQTSYPLSAEALGVLHTALLSLNDKQSKLHDSSLLAPLLLQLQSLRTLIPPTQGDEGSEPCVITGALNYLEQLGRVRESLKEGMQESTLSSGGGSPNEGHSSCNVDHMGMVKVESLSNAKLHILVHCKKRQGLLSSLILALDTLGLVIDQMDISCDNFFIVDVITTQVGGKATSEEIVKVSLSKIIHRS